MAIAQVPNHNIEEELLRWGMVLVLVVGTSIGTCICQRVTRGTSESLRSPALAAKPKPRAPNKMRETLKIKTSGATGDAFPRIAALRQETLAMSPIQEVAGPYSARPCVATACTTPTLIAGETQIQPSSTNTTNNLALSGVILTIDIPPSTPGLIDEEAIVELSEILQRW